MTIGTRIIRAPRGSALYRSKGWPQEAALRMLMSNLNPDVAERPEDLIDGILQGTCETFAAAARRHVGGGLAGRVVVTPGIGVARHADAGYPEAIATATSRGIMLPMRQ